MGVGVAIRKIVHYHVKQIRQKAQEAADAREQVPSEEEMV